MNYLKFTFIVISLWSCISVNALAYAPAFSATGFSTSRSKDSWNLGFQFITDKNLLATALGSLDQGLTQDLSKTPVLVGLWDIKKNLLASVSLTNADKVDGLFKYAQITPVLLKAGQNYYVASVGYTFFSSNPLNPAMESDITYVEDVFSRNNTTLEFPSDTQTDNPNGPDKGVLSEAVGFGANLLVSAVPETETGTMLLAGLALIYSVVKLRKIKSM